MVKVSVVMPVYNTDEKYFRIAIESILEQSFKDFELIIIDDASDNYIKTIVSSYKDTRVKYYKLDKNSGAAVARNFGIEKANGKYIAFMDSDDVSMPNRLEVQYEFLENNKDIDCLGTDYFVEGEGGVVFAKNVLKHQDIVNHLIFKGCVLCQSSVMIKRDILLKNNIRYKADYVPAEDYMLWLDLIGKAKFEVIPDKLVMYRYHLNNISHKKHDLQRQKNLLAQLSTIKRLYGISFVNEDKILSFLYKTDFTLSDIKELEHIISQEDMSNEGLQKFFKYRVRRIYYHAHGFKEQLYLFSSPMAKVFNFSLLWRIFVFITRIF